MRREKRAKICDGRASEPTREIDKQIFQKEANKEKGPFKTIDLQVTLQRVKKSYVSYENLFYKIKGHRDREQL